MTPKLSVVAGLDVAKLAAPEGGPVSQIEAQEALAPAKLPTGLLGKVEARAIVGRYVAGKTVGLVQSACLLHQEHLEKLSELAQDRLAAAEKAGEAAALGGLIVQCARASAELSAMQLKAAEVVLSGQEMKRGQDHAPQLIAGAMQVNFGAQPKPAPGNPEKSVEPADSNQ